MKHTVIPVLLALCVIPAVAAADGFQPSPDLDVAVGIVQEGDSLCVLVFSPEDGGTITAWNATDGVTPMWENPFSVDDAEWGPKLGYARFELDGVRHAAVAVVGGPPEIIRAVDAVPYVAGDDHRKSGSSVAIRGDNEGLVVRQVWWTFPVYNGTTHYFDSVDGPPVEIQETIAAGRGAEPTRVVLNIDGLNHAVVNTVEGPPVLVNALEAATLGLGDITDITPVDYLRWDHPTRLLSVAVDVSAVVGILDGGNGTAYATVTVGNATSTYDITDPLDPREAVLAGNATLPEAIRVATGLGMAHAFLVHPERASLDIPDRFRLGDAAERLGPEGTWAVVATPDGGIVLAETHHNTEVAVVRDGDGVRVVERDGGWEEIHGSLAWSDARQLEHRVVNFGDPGTRTYDMANPASPVLVDDETLHIPLTGWGAPGRAVTAEIGGSTWALIPVREPLVDGPIMEVSSLRTSVSSGSVSVGASITVRNIHHESLTISVDRLKIGNLVLEQHHSYSGLAASDFGDIRLRGPTTYGFVGPTEASSLIRGLTITNEYGYQVPVTPVYALYAVPELDVVFAFVRTNIPITLAPGESWGIGITMIDPCENDEKREIPIDGGCGPWDYNLDPRELKKKVTGIKAAYDRPTLPAEITLVAEGYPEWAVTVGQE